jgi:glutathione S-transferase
LESEVKFHRSHLIFSVWAHIHRRIRPSRYALNIKGLTFKTGWIEAPDIKAFYEEHGIPCVNTRPDGSPYYTLPIIHDGSTNKFVADSYHIIAYLDDNYPNTPTLLPKGTHALQTAFEFAMRSAIAESNRIIMPASCEILNEASRSYFYRTRNIEGLKIPEDRMDEEWKRFEAGMGEIDKWFKKNGKEQKYVAGNTISYADIVLAARLLWIKKAYDGKRVLDRDTQGRRESKEWEYIQGWHGGRWAKLVAEFQQYE